MTKSNKVVSIHSPKIATDVSAYTGKITIHPNQIEIVNESFTPSREDVEEARELLELFAQNEAQGVMAFSFRGQMVDVPHLTRARKIVDMAERLSDRS